MIHTPYLPKRALVNLHHALGDSRTDDLCDCPTDDLCDCPADYLCVTPQMIYV